MKQSKILWWGPRLLIALLPIALFCGLPPALARLAQTQPATSGNSNGTSQELSSEGQAWLRVTITSGTFPDLRWPNFSDYREHVQKFYETDGNSLSWVKGMEPTPQAREVIALLLQADQKGLFRGRL